MRNQRVATYACAGLLLLAGFAPAWADGGVHFTDLVSTGEAGITFSHMPSAREADRLAILADAAIHPIPTADYFATVRPTSPEKSWGAPGVAIFDYDNDGDLDIYATNGPGTPNSLLQSQLKQTGELTFVDVAADAGVEATEQESSGVCYGDIDNDGDQDLFVVGMASPNHLFRNNGNGTFTDVTEETTTAGFSRHGVACSMGDLNNDGLLDIVVANTYDDWHLRIVFLPSGPNYPGYEHNTVFLNKSFRNRRGMQLRFQDVSATNGIQHVSNMDQPGTSGAAHTWAIAMVDLNRDGNIDILSADNQAAPPQDQSQRRGWSRFFKGDGRGNVTDITMSLPGLQVENSWMGVAFGDANCDGRMDFFNTGMGNYLGGAGLESSLFIQKADGDFERNIIFANPFGWGDSMFDFDNDGDADILWHGGMDILNLIAADNPGVLLVNNGQCTNTWTAQVDPSPFSIDHRPRDVEGVATGDLNNDGFFDIVTITAFNIHPGNPAFRPMINLVGPTGSPYDPVAMFQNVLTGRTMPGFLVPVNPPAQSDPGNLSVEVNSADNGNGWVKFHTLGTAGVIVHPKVPSRINRDGIGAVLSFTPEGGPTSMQPILGGSSYASQNALEVGFGLGDASRGDLEVLWPGGYKNKLYNVAAGESLLIPAIPCSFDANFGSFVKYQNCVQAALQGYRAKHLIGLNYQRRLQASAERAYREAH